LALHKEPTDLAILVRDVADSFAAEGQAAGVVLRVELDPDLPLIDIDPLRIRQVIVNLLSNALAHTPRGGRVSVSAAPSPEGITVKVADTGSGIPEADLPKIFDRFYKGSSSRGSGLGLTIARNLVELHDGRLLASSEVGKGTTMMLTLPVSPTNN